MAAIRISQPARAIVELRVEQRGVGVVGGVVGGQAWGQVWGLALGQVRNQVRNQVWDQVRSQVRGQAPGSSAIVVIIETRRYGSLDPDREDKASFKGLPRRSAGECLGPAAPKPQAKASH